MLKSFSTLIAASLGIAGFASAAEFPHDQPIHQIGHWTGTYEGHNDGRRARLTIEHSETTERVHAFDVRLEDLDRDETFTGRKRLRLWHFSYGRELRELRRVGVRFGQKFAQMTVIQKYGNRILIDGAAVEVGSRNRRSPTSPTILTA